MPDKINGYEILSAIGSGAFGRTYRVRKGGQVYAMKVLKLEAIRDDIDRKRFQRECRALQKIASEHVVSYHDHGVFEQGGVETYYVVMGFVEGTDLQRRLRGRTFPLPEAEIRAMLGQVLRGLADIHEQRIIHRDLKPANIFITEDDAVKIVDFGLVKMIDYTTLTMTGAAVGTPLYMSPEEMQGREIDHRSDLYSFGVLLYYLLTGTFPFMGDNPMQLMHRVTQEPPKRPTEHKPDLSNRLENLVLRLLEKEPYLRPSNAAEVAEFLERTPFFRVDETPAPAAAAWGFDRRLCFIRLLHNEKGVIERFLERQAIDGIVFQANYIPRYERHLEVLRARGVPYLFDPSTNRLAYSKFSETQGLRELPYVFDKMNRLTPATLRAIAEIRRYVKEVLGWQIRHGCTYLVAPFHFSKTLTSEWMELDLKLISEAREYLASKGRDEKLFAAVCTNIEDLTDEDNRKLLVNRYSKHPVDGYLFYIDLVQEQMSVPGQLYSYLSMLVDFKALGKPLVACRVGNLGLGVVSLGIDAFETGIASLSFFSEQTLLEDRPRGYTMQVKYYVPDLLANLQLEMVLDVLGSGQYDDLICRCPYCGGGRTDDSLRRVAKEHFLWHRMREMEAINRLGEGERLDAFLKRTDRAHKLAGEIRRKLGVAIPSQHFKTWLEVFPEVAKRL
ncbi:MAG: serine/threonine protein kinase [Candidatus Eiseniibacteriota bacterium]